MTQTGVFLCTCDSKICAGIDVKSIVTALLAHPGTNRVVQTAAHICLPDGLQSLRESIHAHGLDPVVIAACPARFQFKHLDQACQDAGLPRNRMALVDWREGCAWAHPGDKGDATTRALDMVEMGIARAENARPIVDNVASIQPAVLVIGGGIAGLTAARSLADAGIQTILVEQQPHLGGQLHNVPPVGAALSGRPEPAGRLEPDGRPLTDRPEPNGREALGVIARSILSGVPRSLRDAVEGRDEAISPSIQESTLRSIIPAVLAHPNIAVHLSSRVTAIRGSVGSYAVDIDDLHEEHSVTCTCRVGAIILATGTREYPAAGVYRHDGRRVLTLSEFTRDLEIAEPPKHLIYLLCSASRDDHVRYCSKICCLAALNQAIQAKRTYPDTAVTILYRDLYLPNPETDAERVREAHQLGIQFKRYDPANPPQVRDESVLVPNPSTHTFEEIPSDRVVLAVPLVPQQDAGALAHLLGLDRDADGFFLEPHQRVRPEETAERGIFVCGSAHAPVDVDTAILQGLTAAAGALHWVRRDQAVRPSRAAAVDPHLCSGCAQCLAACAFGAIHLIPSPADPEGDVGLRPSRFPETSKVFGQASLQSQVGTLPRAVVDPWLCLSCGNCAVACPTKAIDLPEASDAQILAQIHAALPARSDGWAPLPERSEGRATLPERNDGHACTLVFACRWSGFSAMELAGARRMAYSPHVRVVELPCSARLAPLHMLYAFFGGAERVVVALCPPDECHFSSGNVFAEKRIEALRRELAANGIAPQRLAVARLMGDDPAAWVNAVTSPSPSARA